MSYKDKDRQRAYQRDWVRHKRGSTGFDKAKGSTGVATPKVTAVTAQSITSPADRLQLSSTGVEQGITIIDEKPDVIPEAALTKARARLEPKLDPDVRPCVRPNYDSIAEAQAKELAETIGILPKPKPQSTNPMKVGYVPPEASL